MARTGVGKLQSRSRGLSESFGLASSYAPAAAPPARGEAATKASSSRSGGDARSTGCTGTTAGGSERPYKVATPDIVQRKRGAGALLPFRSPAGEASGGDGSESS